MVTPLASLLRPRSVAVAGASRTPGSVGRRVLEALVRNGFNGPVYAINPQAQHVGPIPAHPSVAAVGEPVDLVVVAVPAEQVEAVAHSSIKAGAAYLAVISAGFAESGEDGAARQQELTEALAGTDLRMVGPNCLGVLTTDPEVSMNASFAPEMPPHGSVALCSQSGALGIAVIDLARRRRLGLSSFVSIGNQADVTITDLVEHWHQDDDVDVILLYVEAFADPRQFRATATEVAPDKPIVMVKAGRTEQGSRAASSHTAALAGVDAAVDALALQANLIRAPSLPDMFDVAHLLSSQPLPPGERVAVVTNSGGPAILCVDALSEQGFAIDSLPDPVRQTLHRYLPEAASTVNPVDLIANADADVYHRSVRDLLTAAEVDILVVVYTPVGIATTAEIERAVASAVREARQEGATGKPVLACIVGAESDSTGIDTGEETVPVFSFPEQVALTLGAVAGYAAGRQRPPGRTFELTSNQRAAVAAALEGARPSAEGWLPLDAARQVLAAAGIGLPSGGVAGDEDAAVGLADDVGYPVALSLASTDVVHKTEHGAVRLGLETAGEVRQACNELLEAAARLRARVDGIQVAPMLEGTEILVGVERTPDFGPLQVVGLGGTRTEVLRDVAFRLTPVNDRDARDMLRSLQSWPLLTGYRDVPAADVDALVDLLGRVSALVEATDEIAEVDLNPVFAQPDGYAVADIRIRLDAPGSGSSDT